MDYSKTHYYKFSNSAATPSRKSTIPSFERDGMQVAAGNSNTRTAQTNTQNGQNGQNSQNAQRTVINVPDGPDTSYAPGFGPSDDVMPSVDAENQDTSFAPGFGPEGDVMPSVDAENQDTSFAPGFGPDGDVMPTLPPTGSVTAPSQPSTGNNNNVLWSWAFLSPIFSNISAVAQARFYNVTILDEPLDIYLNGQLVVSDLAYSEYTDYLYIIPGYYNLTVYRRINPNIPIINARVSFARNSTCMVSILGNTNAFSLQFIC